MLVVDVVDAVVVVVVDVVLVVGRDVERRNLAGRSKSITLRRCGC